MKRTRRWQVKILTALGNKSSHYLLDSIQIIWVGVYSALMHGLVENRWSVEYEPWKAKNYVEEEEELWGLNQVACVKLDKWQKKANKQKRPASKSKFKRPFEKKKRESSLGIWDSFLAIRRLLAKTKITKRWPGMPWQIIGIENHVLITKPPVTKVTFFKCSTRSTVLLSSSSHLSSPVKFYGICTYFDSLLKGGICTSPP